MPRDAETSGFQGLTKWSSNAYRYRDREGLQGESASRLGWSLERVELARNRRTERLDREIFRLQDKPLRDLFCSARLGWSLERAELARNRRTERLDRDLFCSARLGWSLERAELARNLPDKPLRDFFGSARVDCLTEI